MCQHDWIMECPGWPNMVLIISGNGFLECNYPLNSWTRRCMLSSRSKAWMEQEVDLPLQWENSLAWQPLIWDMSPAEFASLWDYVSHFRVINISPSINPVGSVSLKSPGSQGLWDQEGEVPSIIIGCYRLGDLDCFLSQLCRLKMQKQGVSGVGVWRSPSWLIADHLILVPAGWKCGIEVWVGLVSGKVHPGLYSWPPDLGTLPWSFLTLGLTEVDPLSNISFNLNQSHP